MPDSLQGIVQRMVEAGEPEENIALVIKHYKAQAPPAAPKPSGMLDRLDTMASDPSAPKTARVGAYLASAIGRHPAEAGAMAGGALAAPFTGGLSWPAAMAASGAASAAGAGTGSLGRQLVTGEADPNIGQTMAIQGGLGAGGEGAVRLMGGVVNKAVPIALKKILSPSKGLQQEFPGIVQTMRQEQIPVGGSEVAHQQMLDSAAKARGKVALIQRIGGPPIPATEATSEFPAVRDVMRERRRLGMGNEVPQLQARAAEILHQNPSGFTLTDAQDLKQEAQGVASRAYRALDKGNLVNDTGAQTDKAVATGLQKAIETRVPSVKPINQRTQSLMGLENALSDAEMRTPPTPGLNPLAWPKAFPGIASHGVFAADTGAKAINAPTARALRQALLAMLGGTGQGDQ